MKKNRFDRFLSWIAILAFAGCIVSFSRIAFHYLLQIARLGREEGHWDRVFPTLVSVFVFSLLLALGCLVVYRIRKAKAVKGKE
jgi:H+/Cl- antiporter ClcA